LIDLVEEYVSFDTSPLIPALNEFAEHVRETLSGIKHADLNDRLMLEAKIYGSLIQILDKYGLRSFGMSTAIQKYYSYFVVEVLINDPEPQIIKKIKIPLK